ncbi:hypothetical protein LQZ24_04460 [Fructobacillus sp. M1-13]|uniref:Integral membrane protein n=1 Tax=Fructobacillus papyriferae TaxID=2713171 RepID=A0ABS5QRQ7_9LACO|nr:hypothetical protein [Fructobacillus papyriferae]MBS9335507.1 hypothetical protein [Fructobacillus papyriferae]MCD2159277.1 hypothetical protein [Fructobacillus papyriferae]
MDHRNGQYYELTIRQFLFYFILSLTMDALGNGMSVSTNLGSAPWTAGSANLAKLTGWPIAIFLGLTSILVATANIFFARKLDWKRFFGNILFGVLFSFLAGVFTTLFNHLGIPGYPLWAKIIVDLIGLTTIGVGISIYQRVNVIMHPIDDLTNILRFSYFNGSAPKAQMSNFVVAILISLTCWLLSGTLVALNIGTAFAFFCQGSIIAWADRFVFPTLVHGNMDKSHKDIPMQN